MFSDPENYYYSDLSNFHLIRVNHKRIFNNTNVKGLIGYVKSQLYKYLTKGSMFNAINNINNFLDNYLHYNRNISNLTVNNLIDELGFPFTPSYCYLDEVEGANRNMEKCLILNGKKHLLSTPLKEFWIRIVNDLNKYGHRTKSAAKSGFDWKSISHAVRCVLETIEILTTGTIVFPLNNCNLIKEIKQGNISWEKIELFLNHNLQLIEEEEQNPNNIICKREQKVVEQLILNFYKD
jgi:hypothetical protein